MFPEEPKRATVYGVSYPTREVRENLTPRFDGTGSAQGFVIGLLHANVGGNQYHDSYAPCTVSDLANTGFDYWALGHVHTRQMLRETGPTIVYPGNSQGRHPNEPGARGVYLVEVDDHGVTPAGFSADGCGAVGNALAGHRPLGNRTGPDARGERPGGRRPGRSPGPLGSCSPRVRRTWGAG